MVRVMQIRFALGVAMLALLAACQPQTPFTPVQHVILEKIAVQPMTCERGKDCDVKWGHATDWIVHHTRAGIRTLGAHLIRTNNASNGVTEFTVARYRKSGDVEEIHLTTFCDQDPTCTTDSSLAYHAWFAEAVVGLPPGIRKTGPGAYSIDRDLVGNTAQ